MAAHWVLKVWSGTFVRGHSGLGSRGTSLNTSTVGVLVIAVSKSNIGSVPQPSSARNSSSAVSIGFDSVLVVTTVVSCASTLVARSNFSMSLFSYDGSIYMLRQLKHIVSHGVTNRF